MKTKTVILFFTVLFMLKRNELFSQNIAINTSDTAQLTSAILDLSNTNTKYAFTERAIEKVYDFYNYLNLLSNPKYDAKLKDVARKDVMNFFSDASCRVDGKKVDVIIDGCMNSKVPIGFAVSDVKVKTDLTNGADGIFSGTLLANIKLDNGPAVSKEISILIMLKPKQFGDKQEQVWTVFLCDIK